MQDASTKSAGEPTLYGRFWGDRRGLGGIVLSALVFARRWHIGSFKQALGRIAFSSFLFAVQFLFVTRWIAGVPPPILMLPSYFLALLGGLPISGLLFRRRLLASLSIG
jgi:hypothetical protein